MESGIGPFLPGVVARLCYNRAVRQVEFTADALRQFKKLPRAIRPFLKEVIRRQLIRADPRATSRNKFRLRRASPYADYELRAGDWRVFYRVEGDLVIVTLVGQKKANLLVVEGEQLRL